MSLNRSNNNSCTDIKLGENALRFGLVASRLQRHLPINPDLRNTTSICYSIKNEFDLYNSACELFELNLNYNYLN